MSELLQGRCIAVTGAYGNLGGEIARAARHAGARVALIARSAGAPEALQALSTPDFLLQGGVDLTDPDQAQRVMQRAFEHFGRIDVLINVAGAFEWATFEAGAAQAFGRMWQTNVMTTVNAVQAALPHLLASAPGSRIINVGAQAAARPATAGMAAYAASKAAIHKLTESLADELSGRGVTVNALLPGTIDTPQNRAAMPKNDRGTWTSASSIAEVAVFLASANAHAVNGALIPVTAPG